MTCLEKRSALAAVSASADVPEDDAGLRRFPDSAQLGRRRRMQLSSDEAMLVTRLEQVRKRRMPRAQALVHLCPDATVMPEDCLAQLQAELGRIFIRLTGLIAKSPQPVRRLPAVYGRVAQLMAVLETLIHE
jgi:hypothetical protein